ncbi:MAG: hypothetical protein KAU03_02055, partial [Candidatus Altiarchaeales archaeon]|nr:hypothetical protein [Candidatus Altiarchaeales archaeon]
MRKVILILIIVGFYVCMGCREVSPEIPEDITKKYIDLFNKTMFTTTIYSDAVPDGEPELSAVIISPKGYPRVCWGGYPIEFRAYAYGGVPPCEFEWISDVDGIIGKRAEFITENLSTGEYMITLRVSDSRGALKEEKIKIQILKKEPLRASITYPRDNQGLIERIIKPEYLVF